ncbi:Galactinol--sucrose galactosyltransferase-like protein [Drosera capensis]
MAPSITKVALDTSPIENGEHKPSTITLEGSTLLADSHPFLTEVPANIIATPASNILVSSPDDHKLGNVITTGSFVGFESDEASSRHVVSIGKLEGIRFMSIFRFKVWWTTHWTGITGLDLEHETQLLVLENDPVISRPYVLILPIVEGPFRASLQPGPDHQVDVCVESGSTQVVGSSFRAVLYVDSGDDPFDLVRDAMKAVRVHLGTFRLLDEKDPPRVVDKFGWCTWDAFYLKVHPQGVWEGVEGLASGGCPPGFVLIDDGWQSICHDDDPITDQEGMNRTAAGEQMPCRLIKFEENYKFRDYKSPKGERSKGMGAFIRDLKNEFKSVEFVYVWHALLGYWGGIRPNVPGLPESKVIEPKLSKGLQMTMEDLAVDKIVNNRVGLVTPELAGEMYEGLHARLESVGIDGVKVDVIHLLEMLCEEYGGRVDLAKQYYKALTESVRKHFKGNGVIASMEHCNDFMLLGTETISLGRVGDDFWCTDPNGDPNGTFWLQGCHMVHCAYNSLWMGNFIHPDWDMFQSTHPCAEFHAASRAISGGPIYVSDCVGQHNFPLLKKIVLPDGTLLRCQYYALPTRDRLFDDPLHDGKTMLKIWNLNKYTGVIGAFNCQGGGWDRQARANRSASEYSHPVSCLTNPKDVEWSKGKTPISIKGVVIFAVYLLKAKQLKLLKLTEDIELALNSFDYELLIISPVKVLPEKLIQFAPIGLVNMLNSGGAVESLVLEDEKDSVKVGIRGTGELKAFASEKPKSCKIDGEEVAFNYEQCLITTDVPWNGSTSGLSEIEYLF